jgi:hypothetical protein
MAFLRSAAPHQNAPRQPPILVDLNFRLWTVAKSLLASKKTTARGHHERHSFLGFAEGSDCQPDIAGTVFAKSAGGNCIEHSPASAETQLNRRAA